MDTLTTYLLENYYTVKNTEDGVSDVTPSYEQESEFCGTYGDDHGKLAEMFPEEFGAANIQKLYAWSSPSYGRSCHALNYLMKRNTSISFYGREKQDFFMTEAYQIASAEGKTLLIVENLS